MTLNYIWVAFFLIGFIVAVGKALFLGQTGLMTDMMNGLFDSAKTGFEISLGLTGIMSLWLGIMKVGEKAGVISIFSKGVAPFFRTLFRGIPKGHPAYGSIMMNFSANMLGLDNAATPLGLKAMEELQELNDQDLADKVKDKQVSYPQGMTGKQHNDTASDAQIMFLVLNTAGITLIPSSVIALRQTMALEQGLKNFNAADIFLPTLIATFISFLSGLIAVSLFQRINLFKWPVMLFLGGFALLMGLLYVYISHLGAIGVPAEDIGKRIGAIGAGIILLIVVLFITAGAVKRQNVFDHFVEGAKEGFQVSLRIIPFLVAMLVAISFFRVSGCMDFVINGISRGVAAVGLPTDFVPALPVGLMKTLSGSGARGLMVDVLKNYGVDSFQGKLASIIQGSTETTFYVLAVYFGSVNVKNTRHALVCGLIADAVGLVGAICVGYLFFK